MATRRRLSPEERKREILRVAAREFSAKPYDDVRVDAIAERAGASRTLVHHYFGDKRGLFLAVARDVVEHTPRVVRPPSGRSPEEMVQANTRAWMDLLAAHPESATIFLGAGQLSQDPELERLQDELRDRLARRMLHNHLGDVELDPEAVLTMRAATGFMQQAARDWLAGRASREFTESLIVTAILAIVRQVLPEAAPRQAGLPA